VANLGITGAFSNKAGHLLGIKNRHELNILTSTAFFIQLITSVVILIIGLVIVKYPTILIPTEGISLSNVQVYLLLLICTYVISYILQPVSALLVADKQIHIDNYLKFGSLFVRTVVNIILLINGFNILAFAISNIVATLVISAITIYRFHTSLPEVKVKWKYWDKSQLSFLYKMGIWFTIGGIAGILIFRIDAYLIAKNISLGIVTNFVITNKLYQIADTFHKQLFNTTRPYFAQIIGRNSRQKLRDMYDSTFYLSYLLAIFFGVGVFVLNRWFISIWVGEEFFIGEMINFLLCINFILQACVLPNRILLATSFYKMRMHNLTRVFEGLAKLLLGIVLIAKFNITGLITASIIASVLFSNTILNYLTSRFFKESLPKKISSFFWVILLPIFVFYQSYYLQLFFLLTLLLFVFLLVFNKLEKFRLIKESFPTD
jgi:O-antigen/teichoic acid export membrane protein